MPHFRDQRLDVVAYLFQHLVGVVTRLLGGLLILFALIPKPADFFRVLHATRLQANKPDQKANEGHDHRPVFEKCVGHLALRLTSLRHRSK